MPEAPTPLILPPGATRDGQLILTSSQPNRCTVVSLRSLEIEPLFLPQTWRHVEWHLERKNGGPGFEELEVDPAGTAYWTSQDGGSYSRHMDRHYTKTGRRKTVTVARFCREHPEGRFILGNNGHCMALWNGVLTDTEGHGPNTRHVKQAYRLFEPWEDET